MGAPLNISVLIVREPADKVSERRLRLSGSELRLDVLRGPFSELSDDLTLYVRRRLSRRCRLRGPPGLEDPRRLGCAPRDRHSWSSQTAASVHSGSHLYCDVKDKPTHGLAYTQTVVQQHAKQTKKCSLWLMLSSER